MQKLHDDGRIHYPTNPDGSYNFTRRPSVKRYFSESEGSIVTNVWTDIHPLQFAGAEILGYPTQKPVALLERIIQASSNEGDVVLDPFAGCGTTIAAAQKLNRQWIGIDVTQLSIALLKNRLEGNFGLLPGGTRTFLSATPPAASKDSASDARGADRNVRVPSYHVVGEPEDLHDAKQLATENRYQFQYWALSLIQARPLGGQTDGRTGKKGSDKGIDGIKVFTDDNSGKAKRVIVQVKSGGVKSGDIRDLVGTIDREGAAIGVFLTLEGSSSHMRNEAASAGFFHSDGWNKDYPRIQILTVEELLTGKQVDMPPSGVTFKQAEKVAAPSDAQGGFEFE